jgi:hypothetical protein
MDEQATIVVGVDGSECARSALEFALDEATRRGRRSASCGLSLLPEYWATAYGMPAPPPLDELTADLERAGQAMVDEVVRGRDGPGQGLDGSLRAPLRDQGGCGVDASGRPVPLRRAGPDRSAPESVKKRLRESAAGPRVAGCTTVPSAAFGCASGRGGVLVAIGATSSTEAGASAVAAAPRAAGVSASPAGLWPRSPASRRG